MVKSEGEPKEEKKPETKQEKPAEKKKGETAAEEKKTSKEDEKNQPDINNIYEYVLNLWSRLKAKNFYLDFLKNPNTPSIYTHFTALEEKTRDLQQQLQKATQDFIENELKSLKNHSEEDFKKIRAKTDEYNAYMKKFFEDQLAALDAIREKLQEKTITQEEFQKFIKTTEIKFSELKKKTLDFTGELKKSDFETFRENLKTTLAENSEKIVNSAKDFLAELKKSLDAKGTIDKLPKINVPEMKSKLFTPAPGSITAGDHQTVPKPLIPPEIMQKIRGAKAKLSENFNSETVTGRANVAKFTLFTTFVGFLYWRWRRSKAVKE